MKLYWGRNREQSWNTFIKVNHSVQKSITQPPICQWDFCFSRQEEVISKVEAKGAKDKYSFRIFFFSSHANVLKYESASAGQFDIYINSKSQVLPLELPINAITVSLKKSPAPHRTTSLRSEFVLYLFCCTAREKQESHLD